MKRRQFIQRLASTGIVLPIAYGFPRMRAFAQSPSGSPLYPAALADSDRIFVIIRLSGGNDGLNTVIPFTDPLYYDARRQGSADDLSIDPSDVVRLSGLDDLGFHPGFSPLRSLYEEGNMAIVQNVAYPGQNLSHFRSTDIWLSGSDYNVFDNAGWYAKYLEAKYPDYPEILPDDPFAIEFGTYLSTTLIGDRNNMGIALGSLDYIPGLPDDNDLPATNAGEEEAYVREIARQSNVFSNSVLAHYVAGPDNESQYGDAGGNLAAALATVARLVAGGLSTRMYILNVGGYDTHTNQLDVHANLLTQLGNAVADFQRDVERLGLGDRLAVGTISEFGRRVASNGTGTDHGEAAPVFFFGKNVRGGVLGSNPNLADLRGGNLKMEFDFRQLYASILGQWYGATADELEPALPSTFEQLPIFESTTSAPARYDVDASLSLGSPRPNPASRFVEVPLIGVNGAGGRVDLVDLRGVRLLRREIEPGADLIRLDLESIPNGQYLLSVESAGRRANGQINVMK